MLAGFLKVILVYASKGILRLIYGKSEMESRTRDKEISGMVIGMFILLLSWIFALILLISGSSNKDLVLCIVWTISVPAIIVSVAIIERRKVKKNPTTFSKTENSLRSKMNSIEIEAEAFRIRKVWNNDIRAIEKNGYALKKSKKGMERYFNSELLKEIIIYKGIEEKEYCGTYCISDSQLKLAYIKSDSTNWLYFKNGRMFRWECAENTNFPQNSIKYDYLDNEDFFRWEKFALDEVAKYK